MAANGWGPDRSLSLRLEQRFGEFNFLQMIRLWLRQPDSRVGASAQTVRFVADLDAGFPARAASGVRVQAIAATSYEVRAVLEDESDPDGRPQMLAITTPDFCIGSALGPLPEPFLEWMRELDRAGKPATRAFLDLFNNRLNLLRYEIRASFEPGLNNETPERSQLAEYLGALMGVDNAEQASQISMPQRQWLGIGDLLANGRRSAAGLVQVISAQLGFPVKLQPLVGAWRSMDPDDQHRLGRSGHRLGVDMLLGCSTWDQQSRIRLSAGPVSYAQLEALLPPLQKHADTKSSLREWQRMQQRVDEGNEQVGVRSSFEELQGLLRLMLDRRHDAEIELSVPEAEVPFARLVSSPISGFTGMRLGFNAWLKSQPTDSTAVASSVCLARFLIPAYESGAMT